LILSITEYYAIHPYPLPKHYTMKTYWGVEAWLHALSTWTLDEGEWSASYLREKSPWYQLDGWLVPRADLDAVTKKISLHCTFGRLNSGRPARSLITVVSYPYLESEKPCLVRNLVQREIFVLVVFTFTGTVPVRLF